MLFGVLVPWVVNIIDMLRVFGFIHVDSVAIAFGVTGLAFLPALIRYRLLELTPVAWAAVVRGMDDAVIVIDLQGRIVELNPAAERLVGRKSREVLGYGAARVFARWPVLAGWLDRIGEQGEASFELIGPECGRLVGIRRPDLAAGRRPGWPGLRRRRGGALGRGWVLVLRDISASKRAEGERVPDAAGAGGAGRSRGGQQSQGPLAGDAQPRASHPALAVLDHDQAMLERPETPEPMRAGDGDDPA